MVFIKVCPYLEVSFQILGRKWNGLIIHYLSLCPNERSQFTEMRRDIPNITPKALSLKLTELIDFELIEKRVNGVTPVTITYELTEKGKELASALQPVQEWALKFMGSHLPCHLMNNEKEL